MMKKIFQTNIIAQAYLLFIASLVFIKAANFFLPSGKMYLYFRILYGFSPHFFYIYFLTFLKILCNIIHLIPLAGYIYHFRLLPTKFWQYLLFTRLLLDITGHSYELNDLVGIFHYSPKASIILFLASIALYYPSYIACFRYAFKEDKEITSKTQ